VHCANHSLDLVLQEAATEVRLISDTLSFVRETGKTIRESSKRRALYESVFGEKDVIRMQSLCPTRWCVRASAILRVKEAYAEVLQTMAALAEDRSVRNDARAKIAGLNKIGNSATTYFGLLVCDEIFRPCKAVAKQLQGVGVTALGASESTAILIGRLVTKQMKPSNDMGLKCHQLIEYARLLQDTDTLITLRVCRRMYQQLKHGAEITLKLLIL